MKDSFPMTEDQYLEYEDRMVGLCRNCGAERECTEPDARHYPCEECGKKQVFGIQELMLMGLIELE